MLVDTAIFKKKREVYGDVALERAPGDECSLAASRITNSKTTLLLNY